MRRRCGTRGCCVSLRRSNEARSYAHGIPYGRVGKEIRCSVECCVELDALSPTEVRSLLTERFEALFEGDIAGELAQQDNDRARIREALASLS